MMTANQPHSPPPRRAAARPPASGPDVAGELRRLMPRDRWLLDLLNEHQVLTTEQVAALAFDHIHTARNRLTVLAQRGVLARFRDGVRPGSQQWRWTLGPVGAAYIAARDGTPEPTTATVRRAVNRLAASPRLSHLLGINGFFVNLAAHARHAPAARLDTWWSERRCRAVTGDLARPDGHGVWTEDDSNCSFWLEYDRSTEPAHRVAAKLDGYAALHRATGTPQTVLFVLATPARETSLRTRLARHPAITTGAVTVATTAEPCPQPAGPTWAPIGVPGRIRLAHISAAPDY
jgi:hypothetical protein